MDHQEEYSVTGDKREEEEQEDPVAFLREALVKSLDGIGGIPPAIGGRKKRVRIDAAISLSIAPSSSSSGIHAAASVAVAVATAVVLFRAAHNHKRSAIRRKCAILRLQTDRVRLFIDTATAARKTSSARHSVDRDKIIADTVAISKTRLRDAEAAEKTSADALRLSASVASFPDNDDPSSSSSSFRLRDLDAAIARTADALATAAIAYVSLRPSVILISLARVLRQTVSAS